MVALFGRRRLEAEDLAALRIDPRHHVLDRAVLAGRVHRLEDQQQRVGVLRIQLLLLFRQLGDTLVKQFSGFLLVLDDRSSPDRSP